MTKSKSNFEGVYFGDSCSRCTETSPILGYFCYTAHSCTDKADLLTKYLTRTSNFLSLQSLLRKTEMRIESIPYSILVFSEIAVFRLLSRPKCAYTLRKAVSIFFMKGLLFLAEYLHLALELSHASCIAEVSLIKTKKDVRSI